MMNKWKQQNQLYWGIILSVLCFGGFYDWTAVLLGAAVCIMGIVRYKKEKKITISKNISVGLILLQEFCLILSMITSIDRGMNFVGILRFLPIISWMFLSMQYSEEDKEDALQSVPHMGCFTILIGMVALIIPGAKDWFWSAQRIGGFFQYSNTCAIFFLMGMLLLKNMDKPFEKVQWILLFWGILLTGSRTVMLLLMGVLLFELCNRNTEKHKKIFILINIAVGAIAAAAMVLLTGSYQNLARILTIFSSNSTLYGRLLYWKDALSLIAKYPLGLGWRGYDYIQPAVQTGVYSTMYVHNDLLQAFLDGGWIAGIAMGALMLLQVKNSSYRFCLIILFLHCLADIDLQYPAIWFIAILMFDFGKNKITIKREHRTEYLFYLSVAALLSAYFVLPFGAEFSGNFQRAVYFYPAYTYAKESLLEITGNAEAAVQLADEILEQNDYSSIAYDAKALAAYLAEDLEGFIAYKEQVLNIERYDISQYQDYAYLLKEYEVYARETGNVEAQRICQEHYLHIQEKLNQVKAETSALAWKLRDQPIFTIE